MNFKIYQLNCLFKLRKKCCKLFEELNGWLRIIELGHDRSPMTHVTLGESVRQISPRATRINSPELYWNVFVNKSLCSILQ